MKNFIIKLIIALAAIGIIVGFNVLVNGNIKPEHTAEEAEEQHDHSEGPKVLDATLKMGKVCVVETEKGSFDIVLMQKDIPQSTRAFYKYAKSHKFDGVKFGEVKGWMIKSDFAKGKKFKLENEMSYGIDAVRGTVGLAKGNKSYKSVPSFFVIKETSPSVGEGFTIIGYVTKGMDVVDKISSADTVKTITFRKAEKSDEDEIIRLIKEGKKEAMYPAMAEQEAQEMMMKKQMQGPPPASEMVN